MDVDPADYEEAEAAHAEAIAIAAAAPAAKQCRAGPRTQCHTPHTVHLPRGPLLSPCAVCGYRHLTPSLAALAAQVPRATEVLRVQAARAQAEELRALPQGASMHACNGMQWHAVTMSADELGRLAPTSPLDLP